MKRVTNLEISKLLYEIGERLEIQGVAFKPRAYEKAGYSIEHLEEKVLEIYKKGGLKAVEDISGVGVSIAGTIEELFKTGHSKYYEKLKKENKK
ncbi:MAG: DNA polymerase III, partial [Candidatus Azambacteria bacterium]|nr:DNA polymerase III [Candidatus Azambacteria bacterium]